MKLVKTKIKGLLIVRSQVYKDKRGYLREVFRKDILNKNFPFDIMSYSKKMFYGAFIFKVNFHKLN